MAPAIRVEQISKKYILGAHRGIGRETVRDALAAAWSGAVGTLRRRPAADAKPLHPAVQAGEFWALQDVSFEVVPGEIVGVIGRNGAGKSTLLKILSRIVEPTRGRAVLRGRVGSLLEVGTGFHPELTGAENIFLNGSILGMKRGEIRKKFDAIVEFAGVERFLATPVKRYSSGMYVRLAFAVAAHFEPEILIVDEVLAVGDVDFQRKCFQRVSELTRSGRTVLLVSHNMPTVQALATRCLYLERGKIAAIGPPAEVASVYEQRLRESTRQKATRDGVAAEGRIESVDLLVDGSPGTAVQAGQPMSFRITLDLRRRVANPVLVLDLDSQQFGRVVTLNTQFDLADVPSLEGRHEVVCHVGELPLNQGMYSLQAALRDSKFHLLDRYNDACVFEVLPDAQTAAGRGPKPGQGVLKWNCGWTFQRPPAE